VHIIRVHNRHCTCGLYQDYLLPCCHALAALYACKVGLHDGFDLILAWFEPLSLLTAYDYLYKGQNNHGKAVTVFTGLRAVDITRLGDYETTTISTTLGSPDPFADIVVNPPQVPKLRGKQKKRQEASDGKGPIQKLSKPQVCKLCNESGHNRATCKRLIQLEGDSLGLGVL
jgi:hypothetical protein